MIFQITAEKSSSDIKTFYYDNETNVISNEFGDVFEFSKEDRDKILSSRNLVESVPFSKDFPLTKSKSITTLKIQLGLSCNYSCEYCSQKFVERPSETNKRDIDEFISKLDFLEFSKDKGLKIEFWGGEPLVYWKTLKPLAEALAEKFNHFGKNLAFAMITNGSLLTREICSWLYYMGFHVAISHDGPNQIVRGPDPFDDPEKKKIILEFYKVMHYQNRISFNAMMNRRNTSRKEIYEWFVDFTGDETVRLGEGAMIDAYDDDGVNNALNGLEEHFEYRKKSFADIYSTDGKLGFAGLSGKINSFAVDTLLHVNSKFVNQKCGMDDQNTIAVDLKGNVITCHNVSALETAKNGESHLGGNLDNYSNVKFKSATHWKLRDKKIKCNECPVLHLCKGSCMFLDNEYWDITCENSYSDNIVFFARSFEKITNGYIPTLIKSNTLPLHRQDIWGTLFDHKDKEKKKIIPIKVINKKEIIDNIEVYSKSTIA